MKGENRNYSQYHGGPGGSHKNDEKPASINVSSYDNKDNNAGQEKNGSERNRSHSSKSGGGGEQDSHHTHDEKLK